jgi:hypothetical protein
LRLGRVVAVLVFSIVALAAATTPAAAAPPRCGDSLVANTARYYAPDPELNVASRGTIRVNLVDINRFLNGGYGLVRASVSGQTMERQDFGPYNASGNAGASFVIDVREPDDVATLDVELLNTSETTVLCAESERVNFVDFVA